LYRYQNITCILAGGLIFNQWKGNSLMSENTAIPQPKKVLYTAKAYTTGGREGGSSRTSDGRLDVKLSIPGAPGNGTNPEQLFAVGWSSCFTSAMKIMAAKKKVKFPDNGAVDAEVDLCLDEQDSYFIQARLNVSLPGLDHAVAQDIASAAHQICPYSKATRGNINVTINVV
jgi:lipoyl-dependent peroxiredoxin